MNNCISISAVRLLIFVFIMGTSASLQAAIKIIDAAQVGGFFADGSHDNSETFQNYYVGYSSLTKLEERRSFFVFDLTEVSGKVTAAEFSIRLKDFGVIFGKDCLGAMPCTGPLPFDDDPGTPWDDSDPGAWPADPIETFSVGFTPFPSLLVTDEFLPADDPGPGIDGTEIFDSFDDTVVSELFEFTPADSFDFSEGSAEIVIALTALGVDMINDSLGSEIVLTGWMPSFSFEDRTTLLGDDRVEKSEILFGLTDLVVEGEKTDLPSPFLELTIIPLPTAGWMMISALGLLMFVKNGENKK